MSRCRLHAVRCTDCGAMRLGDAITSDGQLSPLAPPSPHAPRAASERVRASHPGPWPICTHGVASLADCVDRPVAPACCRHPPCVLVPPVLPHPIPSVTVEES